MSSSDIVAFHDNLRKGPKSHQQYNTKYETWNGASLCRYTSRSTAGRIYMYLKRRNIHNYSILLNGVIWEHCLLMWKGVNYMKEQELLEALREMPVIDTHEHLENEERHQKWNVLSDYTQHYFVCDLISSGLQPSVIPWLAREDVPILEKWMKLERYWEYCRNTGYGQMLDIAAKCLYGVERICRETIEEVERGFEQLHGEAGFSRKLLHEMCGIEYVMDNIWRLDGDPVSGLFRFVDQFDDWVMLEGAGKCAQGHSECLLTLEDWVSAMLETLEADFVCRGACALKCALAYRRPITFAGR